jgi:hypothetical protein
MRARFLITIFSLSALIAAQAGSLVEPITDQAGLKPEDSDDLTIDGVPIYFFGRNEVNPRPKNRMTRDIMIAWDDAMALANAITEINTDTDVGSYDCKSTRGAFPLFIHCGCILKLYTSTILPHRSCDIADLSHANIPDWTTCTHHIPGLTC